MTTTKTLFFELLLHYALEDILKAENIIPNVLRLNIAEGEPGQQGYTAIVLDDSDDENAGTIFVQNNTVLSPASQVNGDVGTPRAEGPSEASLLALAEIQAAVQARRREREEQERRDLELIEMAEAENLISEEDMKRLVGKRSASPVARVKTEEGNGTKRCKVAVKEEEVDGCVVVTIRDAEAAEWR